MQTIRVEYRDGSPSETFEGQDLAENWDKLMDGPLGNVQHAVYSTPSRDGSRMIARGTFGESHADRAIREATNELDRLARDQAAAERMYAGRDWTYNGYSRSLGTG